MIEQDVESTLRQLGAEWPIPSVHDTVVGRLATTPVRRSEARSRRWPFVVLASGVAAAAMILIAVTVQLSTPATLQAAVQQTLKKAGSAHLLMEFFDHGIKRVTEIWFDMAHGVRAEYGNTVVVDDGKSNWTWNSDEKADGVVLKRPSGEALAMVAQMVDLSQAPPDWHKRRSPDDDQQVNGAPCTAFVFDLPEQHQAQPDAAKSQPTEIRAIVLVDGKEQPRQVTIQHRTDDHWTTERRTTVEYDVKIDADKFTAAFPESSRVVDVKQGLEKLYPIESALAQGEAEGILFAVHKVVPLEGGLYYIVSSARGTPEFLKKYPPIRRRLGFNYTALDVAGHNVGTGTSSNHYTMRLFHVEWYGVEYSWWILAPYKVYGDDLVKQGRLKVPLYAFCYHPDLRDARGVAKSVSTQLEVDVSAKSVDWIAIAKDLRRDCGFIATLWGESESPLVFGSMDNNTLRPIRINDISDSAYADDLKKLYRQLQGTDEAKPAAGPGVSPPDTTK